MRAKSVLAKVSRYQETNVHCIDPYSPSIVDLARYLFAVTRANAFWQLITNRSLAVYLCQKQAEEL